MPRSSRFRRFEREWLRGKSLHLSLMFGSAVRATKAQHIGPDTGQGGVVGGAAHRVLIEPSLDDPPNPRAADGKLSEVS